MTPKLTVLRYAPRENKAPLPTGCCWGASACLLTEPFCHQEEVRICTTTVFVDPYEEADAQIAQERKKTQHQVDPEAKVKMNKPQPGNQGPQTYRQGVGKYINPAAT